MSTETISPPICEKHGCEKVWQKNKCEKTGGAWRCRDCHNEYAKKYRDSNKEKIAKAHSQWREANPEYSRERYRANPARSRMLHDKWVKANPARNAENMRRWRENNKEKHAASNRQWYRDNPEREIFKGERRRARKANALVPGRPVTAAIETERKALFGGCCFCGADKTLTLEHMVPLSKGGLHVEENLLGSCAKCNSGKKDRPVEAWFRKQPFFSEQRWQEIQSVTEGSM